MNNAFVFNLGQKVKMILSDERGIIKGRAEYSMADNSYLVLYKAADGRMVDSWWYERELVDDERELVDDEDLPF
jgi:hypothetical protein